MFQFENHPPEFQPPQHQSPRHPSPRQWKLSTLFLLVTVVAVAASGYSRGGPAGLATTLFSVWFAVLGFGLIVFGAKARTREHFFMLAVGVVFLGLGLFTLMTYSFW